MDFMPSKILRSHWLPSTPKKTKAETSLRASHSLSLLSQPQWWSLRSFLPAFRLSSSIFPLVDCPYLLFCVKQFNVAPVSLFELACLILYAEMEDSFVINKPKSSDYQGLPSLTAVGIIGNNFFFLVFHMFGLKLEVYYMFNTGARPLYILPVP